MTSRPSSPSSPRCAATPRPPPTARNSRGGARNGGPPSPKATPARGRPSPDTIEHPAGTEMPDRADNVREIVQHGLWWEDFEDGVIYKHRPGRTVTEADNVLFTTLTMNLSLIHISEPTRR